ncbi:MAG: hypothetical protein IKE25_11260 [Clostridia bacterium]|nr:hypothetical protein [Clostridia bacterium]
MVKEENIRTIKEKLPTMDIILQLAEEAGELAAAAAKWIRIVDGRNPTPMPYEDAWMHLLEEMADVQNCMECILSTRDQMIVQGMIFGKLQRWADRLQKKEEAEDAERNKSAVCSGRRRARNQDGT